MNSDILRASIYYELIDCLIKEPQVNTNKQVYDNIQKKPRIVKSDAPAGDNAPAGGTNKKRIMPEHYPPPLSPAVITLNDEVKSYPLKLIFQF